MLDEGTLRQLVADLGADGAHNLIPRFIAETRARCARIEVQFAAGNSKSAHRDAHSLKSAARTYGAAALADAALALEEALQAGDAAVIPLRLAAVSAAAADDLPALEAWLAGLGT